MTGQELTPRPEKSDAMIAIAESRVAQEVQAAMVIARKFPRDEEKAAARILTSCKRRGLAEAAMYAYPRGGTTVTGPSIRLAEAIAQGWGNLDFGVIEVESRRGESTVMAYCWDLETNVRQTKVFQVAHARYTKKEGVVKLNDPRDIYEMTANQGARRLRACILGVIPGDIVESAVARCESTLGDSSTPLKGRIRKMVAAFGDLGVTPEMLEKRLGHKLGVTNETEIVNLHAVFRSIKDNMAAIDQFFDRAEAPAEKPTMDPTNVREGEGEHPDRKKAAGKKKPAGKKKTGRKPATPQVEEGVAGATPLGIEPDRESGMRGGVDLPDDVDDDLGIGEPGPAAQREIAGEAPEGASDEPSGDATDEPGAEESGPETAPEAAETPESAPRPWKKITGSLLGRLHMAFRKLEIADDVRLAFLSAVYQKEDGTPAESTKDLHAEDAAGLLETLAAGLAEGGDVAGCREWIAETARSTDQEF